MASAQKITPKMLELLRRLPDDRPADLYRHAWPSAKALAARGLAVVQWIGMGWCRCQITTAGIRARNQ
jgi:hypothetical protein